jgi:hypothetical protein
VGIIIQSCGLKLADSIFFKKKYGGRYILCVEKNFDVANLNPNNCMQNTTRAAA